MKQLLLFIALVTTTITSFAQSPSIYGKIIDENLEALAYANVLLLQAADSTLYKGTVINDDGIYQFNGIIAGNYIVNSSLVGFGKVYSEILHYDGTTSIKVPTLQLSNGIQIDQVTVTAQKPFIELKADKMIVNVANSSVNAGGTALEVIAKAPGVIVDNNNRISLRGKQGVLVTINGKNQYLSGDELSRLLENMPADNIQRMEVITNPSAKYDAEGNSGIINIVLKKNENLGFNGTLSSTARQGNKFSHFHNLNLNHRSKKLHVFGGLEYYDWNKDQQLDLLRKIPNNEGVTTFDQESFFDDGGDGYETKLGARWNVTDKLDIGIVTRRDSDYSFSNIDNTTNISGTNMPPFQVLYVDNNGTEGYTKNTGNVNATYTFNDKGTTLSFDTDYSTYRNPAKSTYDNFYRNSENDEVAPTYYLSNDLNTDIDIFASTLDFTHSLSEKIQIETGLKYSSVSTKNKTVFEDKDNTGIWNIITDRSNEFMYTEEVAAAYINGSGEIGAFQLQAGLRTERTISKAVSPTLNITLPRSYTNFFPSISVSRSLDNGHDISATFSRRLERPRYDDLNPFEYYLDQYTFRRGNSFLNPQYSNAYGFNYAMGRKLFIALNYSHTTDAITSVIEQDSENNVNYQTNTNLDDHHNISWTLSAPKVWSEFATSRLNYTGFYNKFNSVIPSGILANANVAHNLALQNEFRLPSNWNMELSGNYTSKLVFGLFQIDPRWNIDAGFSRKVLNNKGKIKISITDIFKTKGSMVDVMQDDINLKSREIFDSRRVSLNFSYSFGNQKVKSVRRRNTAGADASNRI